MSCLGKKYVFINVDERVSEKDIAMGVVYVCENDKLFQLKCPCECGDTITGQLFPLEHPRWIVNIYTKSMTPSIERLTGCKSHFTITNGITH